MMTLDKLIVWFLKTTMLEISFFLSLSLSMSLSVSLSLFQTLSISLCISPSLFLAPFLCVLFFLSLSLSDFCLSPCHFSPFSHSHSLPPYASFPPSSSLLDVSHVFLVHNTDRNPIPLVYDFQIPAPPPPPPPPVVVCVSAGLETWHHR